MSVSEVTNQAVDWHRDGTACPEPADCDSSRHLPRHGMARVEVIFEDGEEGYQAVCFCGSRTTGCATYRGAAELLYDRHVYEADLEEVAAEVRFFAAKERVGC